MKFRKLILPVLTTIVLSACGSTPSTPEALEQSNWRFDSTDSFAYRLVRTAGMDGVLDAKRPNDSTYGGGAGWAVFGNSLASGGSLLTSGLSGLATGFLSPDAPSSKVHLLTTSNASNNLDAHEAFKSEFIEFFSRVYSVNIEDVNVEALNGGKGIRLSVPFDSGLCKTLTENFTSLLNNEEYSLAVQKVVREHGCYMAAPIVKSSRFSSDALPELAGNALSKSSAFLGFVTIEALSKGLNNSLFFYYPPHSYRVSAGKGVIFNIKLDPFPAVYSKDKVNLFVKNSAE